MRIKLSFDHDADKILQSVFVNGKKLPPEVFLLEIAKNEERSNVKLLGNPFSMLDESKLLLKRFHDKTPMDIAISAFSMGYAMGACNLKIGLMILKGGLEARSKSKFFAQKYNRVRFREMKGATLASLITMMCLGCFYWGGGFINNTLGSVIKKHGSDLSDIIGHDEDND